MTPLPDGWHSESLGDTTMGGLFVDGDWVESKDQDPMGGVRLTQLADVGVGEFRDRSDRWLREDQAARLGCTFLEPGDVLVARMPEPLGRACVVPTNIGRAVTVVDVAIMRPNRPDILPKYLMWALNSPGVHEQMVRLQSGTTRKRISRRNLATISLPVPPLVEQWRIVDILEDNISRLDAAERYIQASAERTEHMATSSLWRLTHGLNDVRRTALSGIADVRLGRQRSPGNHTGPRMRPYLRAGNVHWNRLRLDDVKSMHFSEDEEKVFLLTPGDILVVEASGSPAETGKSVVYDGEPSGVCFQNTLLRVRCFGAHPAFVQKYLLAEAMAGEFVGDARGVGINHLGRAKLASWPIELPSEQEQVRRAAQCDRQLEAASDLRGQLQAVSGRGASLRRALLSAAFSGRLTGRSSDLDLAEEMITA